MPGFTSHPTNEVLMDEFRKTLNKSKLIERLQETLDATKMCHKAFYLFIDQIKTRGPEYLINVVSSDKATARLKVLDRETVKLSGRLIRREDDRPYWQMVVFWESPDEPVFMKVFYLHPEGLYPDIEEFFVFLHRSFENSFMECQYPAI